MLDKSLWSPTGSGVFIHTARYMYFTLNLYPESSPLILFPLQMLEKSLLKFAEESFGAKYCVSLSGVTKRIRPLALIVKRHRKMFKRPFFKSELITLEGLEKYLDGNGEEGFCKALNEMITEEKLVMEPKSSQGERYASTL